MDKYSEKRYIAFEALDELTKELANVKYCIMAYGCTIYVSPRLKLVVVSFDGDMVTVSSSSIISDR